MSSPSPPPVPIAVESTGSYPSSMESMVLDNGPVFKSPNDTRSYRFITLPNKLKALLIHDSEADKAAAALDVNIGENAGIQSQYNSEGKVKVLEERKN